jgi:hypothetical protein
VRRTILHALAVVAVLGVIAAVTPTPASSDREIYQQVGRRLLIRDCADGHCFRPIVAALLEHLPGPSLVKWKAYSVVANAVAAFAVGRFCLVIGLSSSAALAATWLSALGTGALYSLYDCYTSDPLMYMLGPLMAIALWQGRVRRAGLMGTIGVFAKEFAAAPLWIFALTAALARRRVEAMRMLLTATAVSLVWLSAQTVLMALQNYRYGATASADLLHGGFLVTWLRSVGPLGALTYLFTSFGALYLLLPGGLVRAGREFRLLALASVPVAAAFVYVEQPERALWNFHFIVIPLAVLVLRELPDWMLALFVASFGMANLRFGAQLPVRGIARVSLVLSLVIAVVAVALLLRRRTSLKGRATGGFETGSSVPRAPAWMWPLAVTEGVAVALLAVALVDVHAHRDGEAYFGVNQWGYRGPLQSAKHPGVRIAVVGGSAAFAARTPWAGTMPAQLAGAVNERLGWTIPGGPFASVDNLAEPAAGAESYTATLRDYEYLHSDIICVYGGYDASSARNPSSGRHRSLVFRSVGYLPALPGTLLHRSGSLSDLDRGVAAPLPDAPTLADDPSCAGASAPYCAAVTATVRFALQQGKAVVVATPPFVSGRHEVQQRSLAEALEREFGREPRFRYVNLGRAIDLRDREQSEDGLEPTAVGARTIATRLAGAILDVMPHGTPEHGS